MKTNAIRYFEVGDRVLFKARGRTGTVVEVIFQPKGQSAGVEWWMNRVLLDGDEEPYWRLLYGPELGGGA